MLDGRDPSMEVALDGAYDEFHRAQQFWEKYSGVVDSVTDQDGKVDVRRLEEALGGRSKDVDWFIRDLHLSRAAIAIRRKALVADAAAAALADPDNPYATLRKLYEADAAQTYLDQLTGASS